MKVVQVKQRVWPWVVLAFALGLGYGYTGKRVETRRNSPTVERGNGYDLVKYKDWAFKVYRPVREKLAGNKL